MLKNLEEDLRINLKFKRSRPSFSLAFFTDELIFLRFTAMERIVTIMDILNKFYQASKQKVRLKELSILFSFNAPILLTRSRGNYFNLMEKVVGHITHFQIVLNTNPT